MYVGHYSGRVLQRDEYFADTVFYCRKTWNVLRRLLKQRLVRVFLQSVSKVLAVQAVRYPQVDELVH